MPEFLQWKFSYQLVDLDHIQRMYSAFMANKRLKLSENIFSKRFKLWIHPLEKRIPFISKEKQTISMPNFLTVRNKNSFARRNKSFTRTFKIFPCTFCIVDMLRKLWQFSNRNECHRTYAIFKEFKEKSMQLRKREKSAFQRGISNNVRKITLFAILGGVSRARERKIKPNTNSIYAYVLWIPYRVVFPIKTILLFLTTPERNRAIERNKERKRGRMREKRHMKT